MLKKSLSNYVFKNKKKIEYKKYCTEKGILYAAMLKCLGNNKS